MKHFVPLLLATLILATSSQAAKDGRFINAYINPLALAYGTLEAGADVNLFGKFTVGAMYFNMNYTVLDVNYTATAYGARINYYFAKEAITTGFRLSAIGYRMDKMTITTRTTAGNLSGEINGATFLIGLIGYQVFLGPLNFGLGVGVGYYDIPSRITLRSSTGATTSYENGARHGTGGAAELSVGLAF